MSAQVRIAVVAICCIKQVGRPVSISFIIPFHPLTGKLAIRHETISSEEVSIRVFIYVFHVPPRWESLEPFTARARKDSKRTDLGLKELRIIWKRFIPPAGILGDGDRS